MMDFTPLYLTKEGRLLAQKCSELVHTLELLNMVGVKG